MTGVPTTVVKLDDGTGTYPTDISSRVLASEGVNISSYGRTDEFSQAQAATLDLVLDNADGLFTTGATQITPGQGIRLTITSGATTRDRITGRVAAVNLGWPGGSGTGSRIQVTAADFLADLGRRQMRSMLEEEIVLDGPDAYYTLGEAEGSTTAGDTSGNGNPSLTIIGPGTALEFGNGTGPADGLSAVTFHSDGVNSSEYLSAYDASGFTTGGSWSMEMYTASGQVAFAPMNMILTNGINTKQLTYNATNTTAIFGSGASGTVAAPNDNHTHQMVATFDGSTLRGYFDGALVTSYADALTASLTQLLVGTGSNGTISHVAVYDGVALSAGRVASHYAIAAGQTEAITSRLTRLAGYFDAATSTTTGMSGESVGVQATSGRSAYDALQELAGAEGGVLYANGSGTVVLQGRGYRALKTSADVTLDAIETSADTAMTYDMQNTVNKVEVTRTGGASQVAKDATSIATNGEFSTSIDGPFSSDGVALAAAQWIVAQHKTPLKRLGSVTFNVHESSVAASILARDVGDRLALTNLPTQTWSGAGDVTIEGWTEALTHQTWTMTANLLPYSLSKQFILDSATLGVLDSATPIGF